MSNYAIFFDSDNNTYRLPTNPEQIQTSKVQAIEKYEVLKIGQIAIPTHMELTEYSFECEFPYLAHSYVETPNNFRSAVFYEGLFTVWRDELKPIRFIASNSVSESINTLVLIEELEITEKSGEEGDKYISFKLLEYKEFGKKVVTIQTSSNTGRIVDSTESGTNPKSNGIYIVAEGDTLWSIAKKYYGNGEEYTKIYNANKDKMKHPGLLYTGQRLVIP